MLFFFNFFQNTSKLLDFILHLQSVCVCNPTKITTLFGALSQFQKNDEVFLKNIVVI